MTSLALRATRLVDIPYVVSAEHAPENRTFVAVWNAGQHERALTDPDLRHLIVETQPEGDRLGYAILAGLASETGVIEFRRLVVTAKAAGVGQAAVRLVQELAFDTLGAHRLWLDVKTGNARARHVYRKSGFVEEGVLRDAFRSGDVYESLVVMSILVGEYRALRDRAAGDGAP